MLGFVSEGPSTQLQACKTSRVNIMFNYFGSKGSTIFLQKRVVFILLFVNFCYRAYKKMHPTKIECKSSIKI